MKAVYTVAITLAALLSVSTAQDAPVVVTNTDANAVVTTGVDVDFTTLAMGATADNDNNNIGADGDDIDTAAVNIIDNDDVVGADGDGITTDNETGVNEDTTIAPAPVVVLPFNYPLARQQVIMGVNTMRQAAGLAQVCISTKLMSSAQSQAAFQATTNTVTVTGEGGSGPSDRGAKAGFNSTGVAELVGAGYKTADDLVATWLKDDASKAIVLGNYTHLGPGVIMDGKKQYVYYWAVDFALGVNEPCSGLAA